ncbi:hypothetical protein ACPXB1_30040 [Micromonospora sp. DT68]|uniref:hypothetical protein n=1 Tax=Micromonospora TaxID=1873 RepID=UPI00339E8F5B
MIDVRPVQRGRQVLSGRSVIAVLAALAFYRVPVIRAVTTVGSAPDRMAGR